MTAKKDKDATQHDDVSGLFARLGRRRARGTTISLTPSCRRARLARCRPVRRQLSKRSPVRPMPCSRRWGVAAPTPSLGMPVAVAVPERSLQPVVTAADPVPDALVPLRKLRQLDEPAPRGVQPADRPAQTPLERLFQCLLQADARSCAQSPLKRLRSR